MSGLAADPTNPTRRPKLPSPPAGSVPLDPVAERLWQRWENGERPDVYDFIELSGNLPAECLIAVLEVDQRERWQRGERVFAESYLGRFPNLTSDSRTFSLIVNEIHLRQSLGDVGLLDEYRRRFPEFTRQLALLAD